MQQKADLVSAGFYDMHTQKQFETRIKAVSKSIQELQAKKSETAGDWEKRAIKLCQFLELRENLGLYWKTADYAQKTKFSKIVILNLEIQGREVVSLRLKKPFSEDEEGWLNNHVSEGLI